MVSLAQAVLGISERAACRAVGQTRGAQRYVPVAQDSDKQLVARLHMLSEAHPEYGYRRLAAMLTAEGWKVSQRHAERLCREEGIHSSRSRRHAPGASGQVRRSSAPDEVWCCDLLFDGDHQGRPLVWLAVVDECTRECLNLSVHRRVTGRDVVMNVDSVIEGQRRHPGALRTDNASIWRKASIGDWSRERGVEFRYTTRGSPWQNGVVEAFFGRLREELLRMASFTDRTHAQTVTEEWRLLYNEVRPHGALGYLTPAEFRRRWEEGLP